MNEAGQLFRLVRKGYDPVDVDAAIAALETELTRLRGQQDAETPVDDDDGIDRFGGRMVEILKSAEQEAADRRRQGESDADELRAEAAVAADVTRTQAEAYADGVRADADVEAARITADARAAAADLIEAASREVASMVSEGETALQKRHVEAAAAAVDFEQTLASRRERAEQGFAAELERHRLQLAEVEGYVRERRSAAEDGHDDAVRESGRIVADARIQASRLVREAQTRSEAMLAEARSEVEAAHRRRDAVNEQLAELREFLATVGAGVQGDLPDGTDASHETHEFDESDETKGAELPVTRD